MPGETWKAGPVLYALGPKLSHTFLVKNTTGKPVNILGENHSCTCSNIDVDKRLLKPGESTPMTVTVNLLNTLMHKEVSCLVLTDYNDNPGWRYNIEFDEFPAARIEPGGINLGHFDQSGTPLAPPLSATAWVEVYAPVETPQQPPPETAEVPDHIEAVLSRDPVTDEPKAGVRRTRYALDIRLNPKDQSSGSFSQQLSVRFPGGELAKSLISWRVTGPVSASPSHVSFGMVRPGDAPVERRVVIRAAGSRPFKITHTDGGAPSLEIKALGVEESRAGSAFQASLVYTPPAGAGNAYAGELSASATATIRTDIPGAAEVRIPWSVFLKRSGRTE